jgi:glycosyltransferase involved in cell wall biosynthesis
MDYSIIIPAYNAEKMLGRCLESLEKQTVSKQLYEILVVNDGSVDNTAKVAASYPGVKVINQKNQGPAAARNYGAKEALGRIILFTDADCVPNTDWLEQMTVPFEMDPTVVGVKGIYRTDQKSLAARFVQLEYEDKYRLLTRTKYIDFIDTYSAAYKRDIFLFFGGFDLNFRRAANEDVDLSYRISNKGHRMMFNPMAVVTHIHPESIVSYWKKKYLYGYWRMLAVRKNVNKIVNDDHTPQIMKFQPLILPIAVVCLLIGFWDSRFILVFLSCVALFLLTTIPFVMFSWKRDRMVALISPFMIAGRSLMHLGGICLGLSLIHI